MMNNLSAMVFAMSVSLLPGLLGCGTTRAEGPSQADLEKKRSGRIQQDRARGISLFNDGDLEASRAYLDAAWKTNSDDLEIGYYLALMDMAEGDLSGAFKRTSQLLKNNDDDGFTSGFRLYVELATALDRLDEAEDFLKDYTEEDPTNLTLINYLHRVYLEQGKFAEVLRGSRIVLKKDETNLQAMHNLALCYLRTNRPEQARYIIQRAIELDADEPGSHIISAQVYMDLGKTPNALEHLEKAHVLTPRSPSIQNALATLYLGLGDHQAAADLLEGTVRMAPGNLEARINLGNALRGLRDYENAAQIYEGVLKLSPSASDAHYNLGILFLQNDVGLRGELSRYQRALSEFEAYRDQAGTQTDEELEGLLQETRGLIKLAVERREEALKAAEEEDNEEDFEEDDTDE